MHTIAETIGIIPGDLRQEYLCRQLEEKHLPVRRILHPEKSGFDACSVIIAATPFTKDQKTLSYTPGLSIDKFLSFLHPGQTIFGANLPQRVVEYGQEHGIRFLDVMASEEFAKKNAVATAEGAICEAITASPVNLEKSLCLLSGYGRCGQVLAAKLKALGAKVTVLETDPLRQSLAKKEGFPCVQSHALISFLEKNPVYFIFNTAPCPVFGEEILEKTLPDITIIDIASAPGGTDFDYCKSTKRTARLCLGLPGKYAPKSSAQILGDAILLSLPSLTRQADPQKT